MNKSSLKFSIMITSVALAAVLAGVWLADVYREHDSRAMLLPSQVITLFPEPKPLTAFALSDDKNRVFDLASLKGKWTFLFFGSNGSPRSGPAYNCNDCCTVGMPRRVGIHCQRKERNYGFSSCQKPAATTIL